MSSPRPASSVYSDSIELDELLENLSDHLWKHDTHMLQSLERENKATKSELAALREIRGHMYPALMQMNKKIELIYAALADAKRSMEREKVYWISNCTAF